MNKLLKKLYGTDNPEEILAKKTSEQQVRALPAGNGGKIDMDAEECKRLCKKTNNFEYLSGYESRVLQYRITDETVDRYFDIIKAKGGQLENYKKNPVVQFAHNYSLPNVGISLRTFYDKDEGAIFAWPLFFDDRLDSSGRSDLIFRLANANAMRACSIGFFPLDYEKPDEDTREELGMDDYSVIYTKWDLLEFSPVPVPANPNALKEQVQRSLTDTIKSAQLTKRDLDILREFPIVGESAMDTLIRELDSKSRIPAPAKEPEFNLKAHLSDAERCEVDIELRPFPNEHAARLKAPGKFDDFRRKNNGTIFGSVKVPTTIAVIWGHLKDGDDDAWSEQSLRFPTKNWTAKEAKAWLKDNEIKFIAFEPASENSTTHTGTELYFKSTNGDFQIVGSTGADWELTNGDTGVQLWYPEQRSQTRRPPPSSPVTVNLDLSEALTKIEELKSEIETLKSTVKGIASTVQEEIKDFLAVARQSSQPAKPKPQKLLYDDVFRQKQ